MFEEDVLGGLFIYFNDFFQNFSCRTHQNSARKRLEIRKISQIFLRTYTYKSYKGGNLPPIATIASTFVFFVNPKRKSVCQQITIKLIYFRTIRAII